MVPIIIANDHFAQLLVFRIKIDKFDITILMLDHVSFIPEVMLNDVENATNPGEILGN